MSSLFLKKEDLDRIHDSSIEILEHTGIKLYHKELFEYISNFDGIAINKKENNVKFNSDIINKSIKQAGRKFRLYGRDKNKSADFGFDKIVTSSSWGMPFEIDVIKNEKKPASIKNLQDAAIIGDYLSDIDIVGGMFRPKEIPEYYRDVYEYGELVKRTTKPASMWITNGRSFKYIIEIYKLFLDSENDIEKYPPFFYEFENISPLVFQNDGVDILYNFARLGIPVSAAPIPQPMSTGPVTIAGSLALGNAELLAALVMMQLIKPGMPFMYGLMCNVPDPFTLVATFTGAPENVLFTIGQAQLADFYNFPIFADNQITCSNQLDYQMGAEFGINCFIALLLNADLYGHTGIVGPDQGANLLKLILDAETISYLKRIKKGFSVNNETIALDIIKKIGAGGNYLLEKHTRDHIKVDYWKPNLFNRDSYIIWNSKGKKSLIDRAEDYKKYILKNHHVSYVNEDIEKEINKIVKSAEENLILQML
ncbi:MAG: trimethylamine methyltransferase family protein [Actinobacteria bacterium]|nr:trimethylamine methyltransferase family protein [Actinomycetota bacterium]